MVVTDADELRLVDAVIMDGRVVGIEHLVFLKLRIRDGDRGDERVGVRVQREVEELLRRRHLDDVALIDNGDAVGDEADDGEVMRDEEIGRAALGLELFQQIQHLRAAGDVQRGDGFVRNDELRLHNHGARQTDTLALTAGKFVRVAGQVLREQTDLLDDLLDLADAVRLVFKEVEVIKPLRDDVVDRRALV